ncbi:MAG: hypothetical protein U1E49_12865 [Hyphomicrobiaceae bacterium]
MRFSKALGVAALTATLAATAVTSADAGGRRFYRGDHHHGHSGRNLGIGLVTGLVAGTLLYNATRPQYYDYGGEECYRGPKQCRSHWNCWENQWGNEVCEKEVSCSRPLICE